jgi:signal transduction histidine kinase/CheY-like chemotaxis protein
VLIAIAMLISHFYGRERDQLERSNIQTARALLLAFDRDLASGEAAAQALATSDSLQKGDFAAFYAQAQSVLAHVSPDAVFVLTDQSGQQIVNTRRRLGEPLPRHGNPDQLQQVFDTGKSVISDMYIGGLLGRPLVSIDVPVWRNDKVIYDLSVGFLPERFGRIFAEQGLPPDSIVAAYDTKGVIVARSHQPEKFIGQTGAPKVLELLRQRGEGFAAMDTLEGVPIYSAFSRSATTGWAVAIGSPRQTFNSDLFRSLAGISLAVTALLAVGLVVAWILGERISRSVKALIEPVLALGSGKPVILPRPDVREAVEVGAALKTVEANLARQYGEIEARARRLHHIVIMMSAAHKAVVEATDEQSLFQAMCDVIVEHGGYRMAWVGLAENDDGKTIRPIAHAGHEDGYLSTARISWGEGALGSGPSGMAVRTGQPQTNNDFLTNRLVHPWREPALERGYRSSISLPLKDSSGVFGVLTLYSSEPDAFHPNKVALLTELAADTSFGVTSLRTRHDHDVLAQSLFQAQKMESLGQLTGGIAHDFNNLLQIILANLDLSLHAIDGSATIAGYLHNAMAGAEQGAKLTSHLLGFARRQPLRPEPLRVDRLIGDMANTLRRTIGEVIDIELVTSGGLWTSLVDANQLQNAILNLAINARDAMPNGGKLTIELANAALDASYAGSHREVKAGQYVMVAITDTGSGMSADVVERAFEPFYTTKREGAGTGLGLSMVYGFVKQSGGHVKIYSEVGQGTTIKLYLPRSDRTETRRAAEEAKTARGNGETILVAEDDDGVRASVVTQLAELGYRVLAAANGEEALAVLDRGEKVDLLFTDVVMPGALNGRALADRARELVPGLAVIFTSGYTQNAIVHHGRLDEGVSLLSKPYRLAQLAAAVRAELVGAGGGPITAPIAAERPHEAQGPMSGLESQEGRDTILLVEDDELIRSAFALIIEQLGYRAVAVETPSEALSEIDRNTTIRMMITDYSLPHMNGIALSREALSRRPDLPIIIATGHHLDRGELPSASIQVMIKPFRPQALHAAIEAARKHAVA